jgi:hypothetical protein
MEPPSKMHCTCMQLPRPSSSEGPCASYPVQCPLQKPMLLHNNHKLLLLVLLQGDVLVHLACTIQGLPPGFLLPPNHHQKAPPEYGVDQPHTAASLHKHYTKLLAKAGKRDKESQIKQMSEGALLALRTLGNSLALLHMISGVLSVDGSSSFMSVAPFLGIQHMEAMGGWLPGACPGSNQAVYPL